MLLQFIVENVLSFREKAVLSMLAAPGIEHDERQVIRTDGGLEVLRVAAVYGANAAGKSNLVRALGLAMKLVARGRRPGKSLGVPTFRLAAGLREAPSRLEFELLLEGTRWSYGFVVDSTRVHAEWLFCGSAGGEQRWFERDGAGVRFGEAAPAEDRRKFLGFVAEGTRDNQLFLAEARERNVVELSQLQAWFTQGVEFAEPEGTREWSGQGLEHVEAWVLESPDEHLGYLYELLKGVGIPARPAMMSYREMRLLGQAGASPTYGDSDVMNAFERVALAENRQHLVLWREVDGGAEPVPFSLDEESDGTLRLLQLAPSLYDLHSGGGRALVIDELDRSLHTLLTQQVVEAFLSGPAGGSSQLIFTTHDTNLLDLRALPADSVWFVQRDAAGGSSLYSLAEFKGEQLKQLTGELERGYLQGRFGALPFLGDPRRLGWIAEGEE